MQLFRFFILTSGSYARAKNTACFFGRPRVKEPEKIHKIPVPWLRDKIVSLLNYLALLSPNLSTQRGWHVQARTKFGPYLLQLRPIPVLSIWINFWFFFWNCIGRGNLNTIFQLNIYDKFLTNLGKKSDFQTLCQLTKLFIKMTLLMSALQKTWSRGYSRSKMDF